MSDWVTLFHGDRRTVWKGPHIDQFWTPDETAALSYAEKGRVVEADLDLEGLNVLEIDTDAEIVAGDAVVRVQIAPGVFVTKNTDDPEQRARWRRRGVDVVMFDDVDPDGEPHEAYILLSSKATRRIEVTDDDLYDTADPVTSVVAEMLKRDASLRPFEAEERLWEWFDDDEEALRDELIVRPHQAWRVAKEVLKNT